MALGKPFPSELLVIVECLELIPLIIAAVEIGSLGALENTFDAHPIGRISKD